MLILEKQPAGRHTPSTSMSGGIVMATSDVEGATTYLDRCAGGMIPVEVSRAWAAKGTDLVQWLDKVGADLALERIGGAEHPEFEGADAIESWAQSRPSERVAHVGAGAQAGGADERLHGWRRAAGAADRV